MKHMKSICVFAGSTKGNKEVFIQTAQELGKMIASKGHKMVYGGGSKGLMGVTADAALKEGGEVIGVITEQLNRAEIGHKGLSHLETVPTMHERKSRMHELSDSIICLPGGVGTWEEFYESLAWNQLGLISKPIVLLNVDGYYCELYKFTKTAVDEGFLPKDTFNDFYLAESVNKSLDIILSFVEKDKSTWYKRLHRD